MPLQAIRCSAAQSVILEQPPACAVPTIAIYSTSWMRLLMRKGARWSAIPMAALAIAWSIPPAPIQTLTLRARPLLVNQADAGCLLRLIRVPELLLQLRHAWTMCSEMARATFVSTGLNLTMMALQSLATTFTGARRR